jgi:hypothetical protein
VVQERTKREQKIAQGAKAPSTLGMAYNIGVSGLDTLYSNSFLQGLQQAFNAPMGQDKSYVSNFLLNIVKQAPSMFAPTLLSRINQAGDELVRENYSPNTLEAILNPTQAKIPGLAQELPQKIDTFGQAKTRPTDFFDVFLNPAQRQEYKPSPAAKFVLDLMQQTGEDQLAPRTVPKYIKGKDITTNEDKRVDLTGEQFSRYQQLVGQKTVELISKINPELPTQNQVKLTLDALTKAGEYGRREMKKELGLR